jgi:hypothetical protein
MYCPIGHADTPLSPLSIPLSVRPSTASANLSQPTWLCLCKVVEFRRLMSRRELFQPYAQTMHITPNTVLNGATSHVQGSQTGTVRHQNQSLVADVNSSPLSHPRIDATDVCYLPVLAPFSASRKRSSCASISDRVQPPSQQRDCVRALLGRNAPSPFASVFPADILRAGMHSDP